MTVGSAVIGTRTAQQQAPEATATPAPRWRTFVAGAAALLVVASAALAIIRWVTRSEGAASQEIAASGRVEARDVVLTPRTQAYVVRFLADEGESVTAGQVVVELDDAVFRKQVDALDARVKSLQAQVRSGEMRVALAKRTTPARVRVAAAGLTTAEAGARQAEARHAQALRDDSRVQTLVAKDAMTEQEGERSALAAAQAKESARAGAADVARARNQLDLARIATNEIEVAEAELDALRSQVTQAEADLAAQREALAQLTVRSPLSGVVIARDVEPGERVMPGTPMVTLVDLQRLTLKVYVSEPNVGRIVLGQPACVQIDAYPDRVFPARVQRVAQRAEFTPKNVETREERVHLVFAIELALANPEGLMKPGMPADARIGCVSPEGVR